jgi:hypothetical protein
MKELTEGIVIDRFSMVNNYRKKKFHASLFILDIWKFLMTETEKVSKHFFKDFSSFDFCLMSCSSRSDELVLQGKASLELSDHFDSLTSIANSFIIYIILCLSFKF